jgi:hypothetical protein
MTEKKKRRTRFAVWLELQGTTVGAIAPVWGLSLPTLRKARDSRVATVRIAEIISKRTKGAVTVEDLCAGR